jgi:hypothetical protein
MLGYILEALCLSGRLNQETYYKFKGLKSRRNTIAHGSDRANKDDAKKCLDVKITIVKPMLGGRIEKTRIHRLGGF